MQDLNKHVAINDERRDYSASKNEPQYTRSVTRVISPGTLIDEQFMDPWQNNYLLSIHVNPGVIEQEIAARTSSDRPNVTPGFELPPRTHVGLAWIDLSSGDFLTQGTDVVSLPSVVARIRPKEIVLDSSFRNCVNPIVSMLQEDGHFITFQEPSRQPLTVQDWKPMLEDVVDDMDVRHFTPGEIAAGGSLIHYVKQQLLGSRSRLQAPVRHQAEDHMSIDKNSLRALEIRTTIRDGTFEGSLLHSLNRTVTKSGTRMLTHRICE